MRYGAAHPCQAPILGKTPCIQAERYLESQVWGALGEPKELAAPPPQLSYLEERQELRALREAIRQGTQAPLPYTNTKPGPSKGSHFPLYKWGD